MGGQSVTVGKNSFKSLSGLTIYYTCAEADVKASEVHATGNAGYTDATKYYYSETQVEGAWHWVDGVPTVWTAAGGSDAETPNTGDNSDAETPNTGDNSGAETPNTGDNSGAETPNTGDNADAERPSTDDSAERP